MWSHRIYFGGSLRTYKFQTRFKDFDYLKLNLFLLKSLMGIEMIDLQMEICDLQFVINPFFQAKKRG